MFPYCVISPAWWEFGIWISWAERSCEYFMVLIWWALSVHMNKQNPRSYIHGPVCDLSFFELQSHFGLINCWHYHGRQAHCFMLWQLPTWNQWIPKAHFQYDWISGLRPAVRLVRVVAGPGQLVSQGPPTWMDFPGKMGNPIFKSDSHLKMGNPIYMLIIEY